MQEYLAGDYDVVVVGGGHAGCEAALACARMGVKTIMFAINLDSIANMACNPCIGGTAVKWGKTLTRHLFSRECLIRAKALRYIPFVCSRTGAHIRSR